MITQPDMSHGSCPVQQSALLQTLQLSQCIPTLIKGGKVLLYTGRLCRACLPQTGEQRLNEPGARRKAALRLIAMTKALEISTAFDIPETTSNRHTVDIQSQMSVKGYKVKCQAPTVIWPLDTVLGQKGQAQLLSMATRAQLPLGERNL